MPVSSTVVVVAFATTTLDFSWLPNDVPVVVVHNDDRLDTVTIAHPSIRHVRPGTNIGFGAAVNLAVSAIDTDRIVLVNPDVDLEAAHWIALSEGSDNEVRTVPLVDDAGPTSVVSGYPTPLSHLAGGLRLGRFAARGGRLRQLAAPLLGRSGRAHLESLERPSGRWPLSERWVSGAVMALARSRFDAVGGFSPDYFLYYEDLDLCARLAQRFPGIEAVVVDVEPGRHAVGASDTTRDARSSAVEGYRLTSAITYAGDRTGPGWRLCTDALRVRRWWRDR